MRTIAFVLFAVMVGGGVILQTMSFFHLSKEYQSRGLEVFVRGVFARKVCFSEKGWRFRVWGAILVCSGVIVSAILFFLSLRAG